MFFLIADSLLEKAAAQHLNTTVESMRDNTISSKFILLSDTASGGAAAATARLLAGLEARETGGAEWWHFSPPSALTDGIPTRSLDARLKRPSFERAIKNVSREFADRLRRVRHRAIFREVLGASRPRLLNCHNIHSCGLNHDDLLSVPADVPLVWTMHDCWSFHPKAFEWHNLAQNITEFLCDDRPHAVAVGRRSRFFSDRPDVVMVAPSHWIGAEARKALGPAIRIEHIPYGVCAQTFQPQDQVEARQRIGLDPAKIWLGIAATHAYSRKGLDVLAKALQGIDPTGLGLLSWGQKPDLDFPEALEVRAMGNICNEREIAALYSACDVFVCPSRCDNLPNAVLESLACGTPVIGSDAGGIPDMVRPNETGWRFRSDHPDSCRDAISTALGDRACWKEMRRRCREVALTDYSLAVQARRYSQLFDELIDRSPRSQ